jgi:Flp pilus assembly protein TadD
MFTWLKNWTATHPDDTVALSRLAAFFQLKGMTDQAIAANEAILKANPQNVAATVELARLYAPVDLPKADGLAKAAYRLTPGDPEVTHILGRLSFQTGDFQWALSLLQLTAQSQPDNPEVQFDLGEAFYSFGKVSEARVAMQTALQSGGVFTRSDAARRFLAMTDGLNPPTSAQVDDILKSAPHYVPALMAKAALAQQKADVATAGQTYAEVLKNYPDFAPAEKQLAILYARDPANDSKASALALKAHAAAPGDWEITRLLGVLDYRAGDYLHAADLFQQCERQNPQNPELKYYLGMTQYGLKHKAESKSELQEALALNLSGEQANEAKHILAELQ